MLKDSFKLIIKNDMQLLHYQFCHLLMVNSLTNHADFAGIVNIVRMYNKL